MQRQNHGQRPQEWSPPQFKYYGSVKHNDPADLSYLPPQGPLLPTSETSGVAGLVEEDDLSSDGHNIYRNSLSTN